MFENFNYKVLWLYHVDMSLLVLCCPVSTKLCFYKKLNLPSFNMSWIAHVTIFISGNIAVHISFHEPCIPCPHLRKEHGTVQHVPSYERTLLLGIKSHIVAVVVYVYEIFVNSERLLLQTILFPFLVLFFCSKNTVIFHHLKLYHYQHLLFTYVHFHPCLLKSLSCYLVYADLWNSNGHSVSLGWNKTDTSLLCLVFMSTFIMSSDKWTYI